MQEKEIVPGQRWISNAESDLGLGTVLKREERSVTLLYPAAGETRTYAIRNAPLTRVRFASGDLISDHRERRIRVISAEQRDGLMHYRGELPDGAPVSLHEGELSDHLRIATPQRRLLTGRLDKPRWFELRREALEHLSHVESSPVRGLVGPRIDLLPHQLYIAHEVSRRHAPRVLLADEVGLGKTIEAGLILHAMVHAGKVKRALILVPDSLIHQWLIELTRRFNLNFSIMDEARCDAILESGQHPNPFSAEQWALCPIGMFDHAEARRQQLLEGEWDLLVVDEAHHLEWSPHRASPQYQLVESLSRVTPAVLLLTATPEQLGKAGHFARLRLLDPDRFPELRRFQHEEAQYATVADAVARLSDPAPLAPDEATRLLAGCNEAADPDVIRALTSPDASDAEREAARRQLIDALLDRHGTSRLLYRNTRAAVSGFPERIPVPYPLEMPEEYRQAEPDNRVPSSLLTPEALYREQASGGWWRIDPRLGLLLDLLRRYPNEKLLVICALRHTAQELADQLTLREGMPAALFHEGMSLVERDRAAAWFADQQEGARLLICSEIGSEGRNFQFAHHLVLFDLPLDPDLLEQRIGRLDRIGQKHPIRIHIPYFEESAQHALYRWYAEGLDAFRQPCAIGGAVAERLAPMLQQALEEPDPDNLTPLIEAGRQLAGELRESMQRGRDRLLELNSCRIDIAATLVDEIQAEDAINRSLQLGLPGFIDRLLALYGVESEEHSPGTWIFRPGTHMSVDHFPGIPEDGVTCTYHREIALAHEDRQFLTWEHPLVSSGMALLLDDEKGVSSAAILQHPGQRPGRMLLEFLFQAECVAPRRLRAGRFLPPTLIHKIVDQDQTEVEGLLDDPEARIRKIDPSIAGKIISALEKRIGALFECAEASASALLPTLIDEALARMEGEYQLEIERLIALSQVNPNVRPGEIDALKGERDALRGHLGDSRLRLDAVRLLITA